MDRHKIILLINTIKHLKLRQFTYRIFYFIRNKFFKKEYSKDLKVDIKPLIWKDNILNSKIYLGNLTFYFLNFEHKFENKIDWNINDYGKLWLFNLNYFDFLNQDEIKIEEGVFLIEDYINQDKNLIDGKASYPISLRGINWVKFLSKNKIKNQKINQSLYNHYQILFNNPEYHLLGNHLLENGFSLFFGAYYFKDEILYKESCKILKNELDEQILEDGAHFELSTMYHQIMLYRVLDCIQLVKLNNWKQDTMEVFLVEKASQMLSWLHEVTFKNGDIPMVNDSTFDIAPSSKELFSYAQKLDIHDSKIPLSDSGYRMFKKGRYELFTDEGNVGASYQPAHVHSDTFNFVLYNNNQPIIVDTGTSTYEKNSLRQKERSTAAHNTVKIGEQEQTEVWGGFRVAKRAKVIQLIEDNNSVTATHNGYANFGIFHSRKFFVNKNTIDILDTISENKEIQGVAYFHFHPDIQNIEIDKNRVNLSNKNIQITFGDTSIKVQKETYQYALGFNNTTDAFKICVSFNSKLETSIHL
jgi:hypothetical protein